MPLRKQKPAEAPAPPPVEQADLQAVSECLSAVMEWYLRKINGDPVLEAFDLLLATDGAAGRNLGKYTLGDFDAAKRRMQTDLEAAVGTTDRYVYAYRGYWESPEKGKFDGALVVFESRHLLPLVIGFVIAPGADGELAVQGDMQHLAVADWSLFHRQPNIP